MHMKEGMTGRSSVCLWREACSGGVACAYVGRRVGAE